MVLIRSEPMLPVPSEDDVSRRGAEPEARSAPDPDLGVPPASHAEVVEEALADTLHRYGGALGRLAE
jgi:hypothetical protein